MTRTDRLAEAHDQLVTAIEGLINSHDWRRFLDTARRFRTYSTGVSGISEVCE